MLSGCAYLLSQVVSGGNQVQYELNFYVNGLPNEFVTWSDGYNFSDITINNVDVQIDFSISDVSENIVKSYVDYSFNGVENRTVLVTSQGANLTTSATYVINAATSTSLDATNISISFPQESKSIDPNVQRYYVVLDVPSQEGGQNTVTIMNYNDVRRLIIKTDVEKFVTVSDETNKSYRLFTKKLNPSDKPQCVFVGERGKRYTIIDESGILKNADKTGEPEEIVDLTTQP